MRIAHFVQRYPPAVGGSEAYFARLGRHLAGCGDEVTVFTTTAVDLEAFWSSRGRCLRPGRGCDGGVEVRRYGLCRLPWHTRLLKALSLVPHRGWQCWTVSCNPVAPLLWRDAGRTGERFDLVHATAFPYGWVLACARRLARRLGVPFLLTPFLHLGDPDDPRDRTRRAYTSPALLSLARDAERVFVQTEGERQALVDRGLAADRLVLQGMGLDRDGCTGGDRSRARAEWGIEPDAVVIGHLANNSREKGTVDLAACGRTGLATGWSVRRRPGRAGDAQLRAVLEALQPAAARSAAGGAGRAAEARLLRGHRRLRAAEPFGLLWPGAAGGVGQRRALRRVPSRRCGLGDPRWAGRHAGPVW
jgi:glycosyltransferase involved in cell wall biosynthesis